MSHRRVARLQSAETLPLTNLIEYALHARRRPCSRPFEVWLSLLALFASLFTAPSAAHFRELASAWVRCTDRRTITGMMRAGGLVALRPHDSYHRFVRDAIWSQEKLWEATSRALFSLFAPEGPIVLLTDDTPHHRRGPKIEGAGVYRDAIRSSGKSVVYDRGLNVVPLALLVRPPWGGEPRALPVQFRIHLKNGPTHLDLVAEMVRDLGRRFPDRRFILVADGAYAPLIGERLPNTTLVSRIQYTDIHR